MLDVLSTYVPGNTHIGPRGWWRQVGDGGTKLLYQCSPEPVRPFMLYQSRPFLDDWHWCQHGNTEQSQGVLPNTNHRLSYGRETPCVQSLVIICHIIYFILYSIVIICRNIITYNDTQYYITSEDTKQRVSFGLLVRLCLPPPLLVKFVLMCHVCFLLCDDYLQTFKLQLCRRQFMSLYGHYIMTKPNGSNILQHDRP